MNSTGAVIVTWNSETEIGVCLDAALTRLEQVVVVDNASSDGTVEQILRRPAAKLISNPVNRGFAAAVNQGIAALGASYVLLLNPDTELLTGLEPLVEACSDLGVAAAAGRLVDVGGRPQGGSAIRRFPTPLSLIFEILGLNRFWPGNPVNRRYRCLDADLERPADVEQPAGAFLMVRRDVWEILGGFDEGFYPLWFEEVDFLKRARDSGFKVAYRPAAAAMHRGGSSVEKLSPYERPIYWYASLLRYGSKHFARWQVRAVCGTLVLGSVLRMAVDVFRQRSFNPLRVYGRVMRHAFRQLWERRCARPAGPAALAQW